MLIIVKNQNLVCFSIGKKYPFQIHCFNNNRFVSRFLQVDNKTMSLFFRTVKTFHPYGKQYNTYIAYMRKNGMVRRQMNNSLLVKYMLAGRVPIFIKLFFPRLIVLFPIISSLFRFQFYLRLIFCVLNS